MPSTPTITVPRWPAARRPAELLRIGGLALAIFVLEAVLAHGAASPGVSKFVLLFVGVLGLAFVFRFPLATALVLLALSDFIFHPTFFSLPLGPVEARPHELALAGLLCVALIAPKRASWGGHAGAALAIFFGLVVLSGLFAVTSGAASASDALNWGRPLGLLALFYVVVRLFPAARERRALLLGAAMLAALTGAVAILISLGAGFGNALQAPGGNAIQAEGDIDRVRLAGLSAGYALFWYAVVQLTARRGLPRLLWAAILTGIAVDIAVSFNRNMWLGLAIGFVLMTVVGGVAVRTRLATAAAVATAGVGLLVLFAPSTGGGDVVEPVVSRGVTIFHPDEIAREASLVDRAEETDAAWRTARENLVLGVGVGAPLGPLVISQVGPSSFETTPQLFLHNQYLYLLLIAGIPGLLAFVAFLGIPVVRSVRRLPRDPAIAACGVGVALIMISAVVAIYFTVEDMTAILGLLTGVLIADAEGPAATGEPSGLLE